GVLNDWDLAVDLHAPTAGATPLLPPPFMAVDMLEQDALKGKIERLYRHDLESLFYVLTWAALLHFGFKAVGPTSTWAAGPTSTWAAGPTPIRAAAGSLAKSLRFHLRTKIHSREAEVEWDVTEIATPPEEEDAPEKDWKEFSQVFRIVGQKNPALDYLADLVADQ
ncbi:hypothetical protein K525DRAFT_175043, partial [Schizophyllum commune Loenen D]